MIWLGKADDAQSLELLEQIYQKIESTEVKEDVLYSIASHEDSSKILPFLQRVLTGNSAEPLVSLLLRLSEVTAQIRRSRCCCKHARRINPQKYGKAR
jgi:hypothetical protein